MQNKKKIKKKYIYIQSLFISFAIMDTESDSTTKNDELNNEDNELQICLQSQLDSADFFGVNFDFYAYYKKCHGITDSDSDDEEIDMLARQIRNIGNTTLDDESDCDDDDETINNNLDNKDNQNSSVLGKRKMHDDDDGLLGKRKMHDSDGV
jgi:hypothetical protein